MFSKKLLMVEMNTRYLYSLFLLISIKYPILNIKIIAAASIKKNYICPNYQQQQNFKKINIFNRCYCVVNVFVFINLRISST